MRPEERAFVQFMQQVRPARDERSAWLGSTITAAAAVGAALVLSDLGFGLAQPLNNGAGGRFPFFPAVVIAGYLRGKSSAWLAVGMTLLIAAIRLPSGMDGLPWLLQYSLVLCLCAGFSTGGSEPRCRSKGSRVSKDLLLARDRFAARLRLGQNSIEQRRAA
jgi:hypothetical protein